MQRRRRTLDRHRSCRRSQADPAHGHPGGAGPGPLGKPRHRDGHRQRCRALPGRDLAESYPPQCGGPAITNWVWKDYRGTFEQQGSTRWATYAVTGGWDGTSFEVTEAIMGALWDPMRLEPPVLPEPGTTYSQAELETISEGLSDELPGYQGSYADQEGHVLADVTYDDGTLQAYVDEAYGANVVVVSAALVDVG